MGLLLLLLLIKSAVSSQEKPSTSLVPAGDVQGFCCCPPIDKSAGSSGSPTHPWLELERHGASDTFFCPTAATEEDPGGSSRGNGCLPAQNGLPLGGAKTIFLPLPPLGRTQVTAAVRELAAHPPTHNRQANQLGKKHFSPSATPGNFPAVAAGETAAHSPSASQSMGQKALHHGEIACFASLASRQRARFLTWLSPLAHGTGVGR